MKRIFLFLSALVLSISTGYGQKTNRISLNMQDAFIKNILQEIEEKTDYTFFYPDSLLHGMKTSITIQNETIQTLMDLLTKDKPLKYQISNYTIYISQKEVPDTMEKTPSSEIRGFVRDSYGEPLIGVSIQNKNSLQTVTTSIDGEYRIEAKEDDRIQFSYIGFRSQILTPGTQTTFHVSLQEEAYELEELVVVGYGVQRKSDLTSSISKVSFDKLADMPLNNIEMALQGQAAGVNISGTSGRPGSDVQIRIRGIGTVNNNEPLYVVDGMPVSSISYLNMADVESIEILKDASSAAIYGTRAANGVVMVSTKKGTTSGIGPVPDLEINFDSYYGIVNPTRNLVAADADEYLYMVENIYGSNSTTYNLVKKEYDKGYNTDWWEAVKRKNAALQNYNLSVTGGSSKATFLMSGGYMSQEGIDRTSSFDKISFRLNTSYKAKDYLRIGENISITKSGLKGLGGTDTGESGFVGSALRADPLYPILDPEKKDSNPFNNYGTSSLTNIKNPVAAQARYIQTRNKSESLKIVGNVFAEITFLKNFIFKTDVGIEMIRGEYYAFNPVYYLKADDRNNTTDAWSQFDKSERWTWINTLNYVRSLGLHQLNVTLGQQSEEYIYQNLEGNKFGQPNNNSEFQWISGGISGDRIEGSYYSEALLSYFGRVNYSFNNRYLFSASIRRDGSSQFAVQNRWGTFPAASAGWRISEEKFFQSWKQNWLNGVKLRLGWGQLGNQRISSGAYKTFIEGRTDTRFYFNGEEAVQGYGPVNAGNPEVSWEKTETTNIGLDLNLLNSRLNVTFDLYNKDTKDMLIQIPIPDMFGTFSPWENIGKVNNKGWEISADYSHKIGKVNVSAGFNISAYTNEVKNMGGTNPYVDSASGSGRIGGYSRTNEGDPIGYFYGYKTAGIFQTPEDVMNYVDKEGVMIQPNAQMGDFKFVDINNDGVIDENDKIKIGSPHPDFSYGLNLSAAYAGFDFSLLFNGVQGNEIFNAFKYYSHQPLGFANVTQGTAYEAWTIGSGIHTQPRMTVEDSNDNFRISDYYVENGSYLRLKNVQLGYTLPQQLTRKLSISMLRVYMSAQNLFTITNYSGLDPEVATNYDRSNGIDIGVYPQTRVFQIGLNLKF